ncbi:MAG: aminopeptidase [Bacteroidales bacterium]|nr:aminopeptidase [Bacteroidales bacterium]
MKAKIFFLTAVAVLCCGAAFAQPQQRPTVKLPDLEFTTVHEVPITSIKDQASSGTCWCFSALSFLESELIRTKGITLDLSEMFIVGHSYHDRAEKYVRLDGSLGFGAGSEFGDVLHVIENYGIVTEDAFHGMNYGYELPNQGELDSVLKAYVGALTKGHGKKLTTAWLNGFDGILAAYLGEYPETFVYEGATYTPESFRDWLGIKSEDYVSLTSFTHHPFYKPFVIEVEDNWRWDASYNLPIDEFMEVMYNAIDNGYTVLWGTDVSEAGFTRSGVGVIPEDEEVKKPAGSDQERWTGGPDGEPAPDGEKPEQKLKEKEITQEMRQIAYDNKQTTDDHGMHIYGTAVDQNGNLFFMVKNSWGDSGDYHGTWYCSDAFVKYKTLNILVHKDALPKEIKSKLGL